jgi:hypothetical protein
MDAVPFNPEHSAVSHRNNQKGFSVLSMDYRILCKNEKLLDMIKRLLPGDRGSGYNSP